MLFEVAIISKELHNLKEHDKFEERLVFGPKAVVAKDDRAAAISAVIDNAEQLKDIDREQMEVLVRPFVNR